MRRRIERGRVGDNSGMLLLLSLLELEGSGIGEMISEF